MRKHLLFLMCAFALRCVAESSIIPDSVANPIIPGFNPDPSVCRVGDDYYLVTSSFAFFPGLPIYHSKDLVNWELVGHAIDKNNIDKFHFEGLEDNDGIWAPTIRHHDGKFYISSTMWRGGGNFILNADNPSGPWSDPIWVPDASGIDPTLFWDEDGKAYYLGNRFDFKQKWSGQVAIHIQEIDIDNQNFDTVSDKKTGLMFEAPIFRLKGDNVILGFGHAMNAKYAEGPHLYKIDGKYYLLMAEGGSGSHHAVTIHRADSIFGPYIPQQINPVLTHRNLGNRHSIQNIGHADIVQTQNGDWYAVCLGNRHIPSDAPDSDYVCPLGRETWLTKVEFQNGQIIMAPETGTVTTRIKRPNLPWSPTRQSPQEYMPLTDKKIRLQKVVDHKWEYERTINDNSPECGIVLFRTVNSNYRLIKTPDKIVLKQVARGKESTVEEIPYEKKSVSLGIVADGMNLEFLYNGNRIGSSKSILPLCDDGKYNKFNGTGVGYVLK